MPDFVKRALVLASIALLVGAALYAHASEAGLVQVEASIRNEGSLDGLYADLDALAVRPARRAA